MTTKEKAEELLHKFQQVEVSAMYTDEDNDVCIASDKMYTIPSIQCAIITVEEIIAEHKSMPVIKHMRVIYWIQVLTELKAMQ